MNFMLIGKISMSWIKERILHPLKMCWYDMQIKYGSAYRFFSKQMEGRMVEMRREHYHVSDTVAVPAIVMTCNGYTWSGGLADRLKGIISVFWYCQKYNRPFKVNFCDPFRLHDYLIPNEYNWLPDSVIYEAKNVEPVVCLREPRTGKYLVHQWDEKFPEWMNTYCGDPTKQYHIYTNMYLSYYNFSENFHKLFRPCERLQKEITYHKQQMGGKYISISFRFTTLLGDFTDCTGAPLPNNEREDYIQACLNAIREIHKTAPAHDCILITADSSTFLERVQHWNKNTNTLNLYVIPGKVGHIDYDHGDDVNMKTFLDFLMVAEAESVYLVKHGKMYGSAFAKTAAMVNNKLFMQYDC